MHQDPQRSAKILWGYQAQTATSSARVGEFTDFDQVVNPHMMICGDSGTGKTHTIRWAVGQVVNTTPHPVRFHLFDVHGDIELGDEMTSTVEFSAASHMGLNPLKVIDDPRFGGVMRTVQTFISNLQLSPTTKRSLGPKQQDVLRNLLLDVFASAGYYADDPTSWKTNDSPPPQGLVPGRVYIDLPFAEKEMGKRMAQADNVSIEFDTANKCWHVDRYEGQITRFSIKQWGKVNPTLSSLVRYATRRREMSFLGAGQRETALLDVVHRKARVLLKQLQNSTRLRNNNGQNSDEDEKGQLDLEKAKKEAIKSYTDYVSQMEHGSALESMLKYDSFDSLSTVKQIIDSLDSTGIFRDTSPNFDTRKPVWRYHLKALRAEEQKFLLAVRLREIFARAVQRGESDHVREVIVIDEGAKFVEDDDEHIINVIALEARKFGLAIWFASQSPTQYPEALLSTVATKVILGLDPNYWPLAQRQLRINEQDMRWIRPREGLLVNRKLRGQSAQNWSRVITPSAAGISASTGRSGAPAQPSRPSGPDRSYSPTSSSPRAPAPAQRSTQAPAPAPAPTPAVDW